MKRESPSAAVKSAHRPAPPAAAAAGAPARTSAPAARYAYRSGLGRLRLKTMDLYVAKQFAVAYGVCAVSFTGLFVLIEAFAKLDRFLRQDSSLLLTLVKYHCAMIPTAYANYMGPILTLAAGMFTMTTLHRQNELTPFKSAGVSVYRLMAPVFAIAAFLMAGTYYLREDVIPRFRDPIRAALALARSGPLNPLPYFDKDRQILIKVSEYSTTRKIARGIEISSRHSTGMEKEVIDANQMEWVPRERASSLDPGAPEDGHWVLHEGSIQRQDENGNLIVNASATRFERLKEPFQRLDLETSLRPIDLETSDVEISYLSWRDLKTQYQRQPYHRHLEVKLHHHFAFPLSHVVLLFLGLPFVLNLGNRSGFVSLLLSFGICAAFYLVTSVCMNIANQSDILKPIFAAWLPVMLFGSLGITMFDRLPT